MTLLTEILDHNKEFVDAGEYVQFFSDKFPNRGLAILSCMDARIIELLNQALGLKNGDAKICACTRLGHPPNHWQIGFGGEWLRQRFGRH